MVLAGHASPKATGLANQTRAFLNVHALDTPESGPPEPFIARLDAIANYDYVARSVALAAELDAHTVVEIGCGDGRTLRAIRNRDIACKIVGIDTSRENIKCFYATFKRDESQSFTSTVALMDHRPLGFAVPVPATTHT